LAPRKLWYLWAADGESEWGYEAGYSGYDEAVVWFRGVRVLNQVFYGLLLAGFAWSLMRIVRDRRLRTGWITIPVLVAGYTSVISIVFNGQSRYHHNVMPWIIILVAWQLSSIMQNKGSPSDTARKSLSAYPIRSRSNSSENQI
jgi:hypothetical protein